MEHERLKSGHLFSVGLTGGIGSGKTLVADRFASLGATIIDSDVLAHTVTAPGGAAMPAIEAAFGREFVAADGSLDRARMRALVFSDSEAKRRLESITHPLIRAASEAAARAATGPYRIFVIPLLVESLGLARDGAVPVSANAASGMHPAAPDAALQPENRSGESPRRRSGGPASDLEDPVQDAPGDRLQDRLKGRFDRVLVVDCAPETQIERVMRRNGFSRAQVEAIIARQASRSGRLALADDVIENDKASTDAVYEKVDALHRRYLALAGAR
ncbi:dephospho-CoA kinase [Pararobbsia alpina]|uniref:Dephospho-CoA kinase n=1 Tax=Pararobbsia alpina TaxID=621374 RepID=A0A6S7ATN9_9BURK|nr:dephospho-CoA kinase [Pararobbsia alpina]CAB3777577.1 Dephospho-CoA kinase [Pararobbsia alpina]